ncbi:MAG: hypothetical protein LBS82_00475 [Spirochaetaceae bacterium]|nr:hypothetical protein [Spirochaetaceae bacterium]
MNLLDSEVALMTAGYWKGTLTGSWGLSRSSLGWGVASVESPVLFVQEADLTLSLWLRERWFVEASFQEDYDVNAYRAGFKGGAGDFIRYAGVGNAGLDFPLFPYLDLGGDGASSFGFYGRAGEGPWSFHVLARYDDAAREERVFEGGRERTHSYAAAQGMLRGVSFVLPREGLSASPVVYVEDAAGPLLSSGAGGTRRWRLARPSEASVSARYGLVELSLPSAGLVAVAYAGDYEADMGGYRQAGSFLGDVQDFFGVGLDLDALPQPGGGAGRPATLSIGGTNALVVWERGAFSPFERLSRYEAPVSGAAGASLVSSSTGDLVPGFELYELSEAGVAGLPLYGAEESGVSVYARAVYNLVRSGQTDVRSAGSRWPLARDAAGEVWLASLYSLGKDGAAGDVRLRFTSYGALAGYLIGIDVIPGSIEVLRGGISDGDWVFDKGSGTVRLGRPALTGEAIRIRYLRRSLDARSGSVAIGLGGVYEGEGRLSARLGLGLRWNVLNDGFSEAGRGNPGQVGFGGKLEWKDGDLAASLTLGGGYEQPDATGLYRVAGMEGNESTLGLPDPPSSFVSNAPSGGAAGLPALPLSQRADLSYRNYLETSALGQAVLREIDGATPLVPAMSGPYPARDGAQSARVLVAEFALDGSARTWSGFQAPLPDGNALSSAREVVVPFRFYGVSSSDAANVTLVLQFGPLSAKDGGTGENQGMIVERSLSAFSAGLNAFHFVLTDGERGKLAGATQLRLLAISRAGGKFLGRILLAPPIVQGALFSPLLLLRGGEAAEESGESSVRAAEVYDAALAMSFPELMRRLHGEAAVQRALEVSWQKAFSQGEGAGAGGRVGVLPLSEYKALSFFFKGPASGDFSGATLDVYAARGKSSLGRSDEIALQARVPLDSLDGAGAWRKLELRYGGEAPGVYAAGSRVADLAYRPGALKKSAARAESDDEEEDSAYVMVFLSPPPGGNLPFDDAEATGASFFIDEIVLEEGDPALYLNVGAKLSWKRTGVLLSFAGLALLEDALFEGALESATRGKIDSAGKGGLFAGAGRSRFEALVLGTHVSGALTFSGGRDEGGEFSRWQAEHGLWREAGPLRLHEDFFFDPSGARWKHKAGFSASGDYRAHFEGEGSFENEKETRAWRAGLGAKGLGGGPFGASLDADWRWVQAPALGSARALSMGGPLGGGYGEAWLSSWKSWAPDAGEGAAGRVMRARSELRLESKPVGAVFNADFHTESSLPALRSASGTVLSLDFPFSFGAYGGAFRFERHYERSVLKMPGDAAGDFTLFGEAFAHSGAMLGAAPFYALFDPALPEAFREGLRASPSAQSAEGARAGDLYRFTMQLPSRYGAKALIVPRSLEARIDRNLTMRYDTMQDVLGLGGALSFAAVDLFGSAGAARAGSLYRNDEFRHAIEAAVALPRNDENSWRISMRHGAAFFGAGGASLRFDDVVGLLNTGWTANFILEWAVPTEKSLLGSLYAWFFGRFLESARSPALASLAKSPYERLRKEKLELSFDYSNAYPYLLLSAGHESIVRIAGRLELGVFARLSYSRRSAEETQSFIAAVGASLNVSF